MRILLIFALLLPAFTSAQANDGDTLTINGITYRLDGIDAPELDQNCIDEVDDVYPCGQFAHKVLQQFIAERPIHCDDLGPDPKYPQRRIGHFPLGTVRSAGTIHAASPIQVLEPPCRFPPQELTIDPSGT